MSDNVLAQLRQVDAELLAQEKEITAQLASLQEKRNGIKAVVSMYSGKTDEAESVSSEPVEQKQPAASTKVAKSPAGKKTTASKDAKVEKKTKKPAASKASTAQKRKKDGRTASWQKYTRPGVKNESIPDAVQLILETQPDKEFKIADVMTALFKDTMPKAEYLKARNRISNVLSGGVRAGDWYKGARGTYRMTAA